MLTNSLVSSVWLQMASSFSLASFSTPVDKADSAKIHDMYLGNCLSIGLQSFVPKFENGQVSKIGEGTV